MPAIQTSDGTSLHVTVRGAQSAPAILLINSLGTDHTMWDQQMPALVGEFRVVTYDARGHGRSQAPSGPYSIDQLADDARAVVDAIGLDRVHLCGSSLGGLTALAFALLWPDRVARAVFANTAARIGDEEGWQERIQLVRREGMRGVAAPVVERFFSATFRATSPDVCDQFRRVLAGFDPEGYVGACGALRDADLSADVQNIDAETLVIAGAVDEATPPDQGLRLHKDIPGSDLLVLGGAGHLSNIERPHAFNAGLLTHLLVAEATGHG